MDDLRTRVGQSGLHSLSRLKAADFVCPTPSKKESKCLGRVRSWTSDAGQKPGGRPEGLTPQAFFITICVRSVHMETGHKKRWPVPQAIAARARCGTRRDISK